MSTMQNDPLKSAYLIAIEHGFTQESVARHTKIPVESLRKFKQGESMGPDKRESLSNWLDRLNGNGRKSTAIEGNPPEQKKPLSAFV